MKKLISVIALLLVSVIAMAQKGYDSEHKYDLFSNLEIGISGQYSYAIGGKTGNWGADIRMTKRIGNNWRLRGIADLNGFGRKQGFDRYAKVMAGMSADFLPFYIFADYGVSFNPSAHQKFNPAGDAGIGLHFDIGRGLRLYTEVGADRTANGDPYKNQILSEERARAVYFAIVNYGIEPSRLFIVGNGMTDNDAALDQKVIVKKSY